MTFLTVDVIERRSQLEQRECHGACHACGDRKNEAIAGETSQKYRVEASSSLMQHRAMPAHGDDCDGSQRDLRTPDDLCVALDAIL